MFTSMPLPKLPSKVLLAATLLAGCGTVPEHTPEAQSPLPEARWSTAAGGQIAGAEWWKAFNDPALPGLIEAALRENPDISLAAARIREARASVIAADAALLPRLDAQLAQQAQRMSGETGRNFPGMPRRSDVTSAGLQLSWEIDLWDRAGSLADAATADAVVAARNAQATRVALSAEVARSWFAIRSARETLVCLETEFSARMEELALTERRFAAGLLDGDPVSAAKLVAAQAKADEADGRRRLRALENALRVLIGVAPGTALPATDFDVTGSAKIDATMPEFGAGVPSELLLARPDVRAAESQIDAAVAREGAARADYFPRLTLVGDAGWQADPASRVGRGSSGFWSLTPSISLPIFDGQRIAAADEVAQARFDAARANYRKVVLNAFREVDDALVDIREIGTQEMLAEKVVAAVRDRLANAEARAKAGLVDASEVISARLDLLLARRTLAGYGWERRQAAVRLAAATGGGWNDSAAQRHGGSAAR